MDFSLPDSLEGLVSGLYREEQSGVLVLPSVLPFASCSALVSLFREREELFHRVPFQYGRALQEFDALYRDVEDDDFEDLPLLEKLFFAYSSLYSTLGYYGRFSGKPSYVAVHRYAQGSLGMTFHSDYSSSVNIIALFVLSGMAPFLVSHNAEIFSYAAGAGSLILLRAPRTFFERDLRPVHAVGVVAEERFVVIFREKSDRFIKKKG